MLSAQALTDANTPMERHFPGLGWSTWGDVLRELQLDLVVHGKAVSFDWHDLARRSRLLPRIRNWPRLSCLRTDGLLRNWLRNSVLTNGRPYRRWLR